MVRYLPWGSRIVGTSWHKKKAKNPVSIKERYEACNQHLEYWKGQKTKLTLGA